MEKAVMGLVFLMVLFVSVSNISALCEERQIDINTASAEKLDELYGIGPVKAEAIINTRPFDSVDDLINVYGIGEITLEKIKEQGLACVEDSFTENPPDDNNQPKQDNSDEDDESDNENEEENSPTVDPVITSNIINNEPYMAEAIILNPKDIKTTDENEKISEENYSIYGLVVFCIFLAFLYIIQRKRKNEFD